MAARAADQGRGPGARHAAGARQPVDQDGPARRSASRSTTRSKQSRRPEGANTTPIRDVRELIDIARKLEGTNRNAGTHAAGVVIANGPLTDYVPLQRVMRKGDDAGGKRDEAVVTTQWVMGDLEKVGLLKMDFLGPAHADAARQRRAPDREDARRSTSTSTSCRSTIRRPTSSCSAATPRACSSSNPTASANCSSG